jgi:hypothetical protein
MFANYEVGGTSFLSPVGSWMECPQIFLYIRNSLETHNSLEVIISQFIPEKGYRLKAAK